MSAGKILVCFAVKEEAAVFRRSPTAARVQILLVGMGKANAEKAIRAALAAERPALVITSGCAGGLNPKLVTGDVVFSADEESALRPGLRAQGALDGKFHCAERVAITAEEKWTLWQKTGADAVEMESEVIRAVCHEHKIPSATVRVILDQAGEDLPLDFNALMTADMRLDFGKLARVILKAPGKIGALLRFQRQTRLVARKIARVLEALV